MVRLTRPMKEMTWPTWLWWSQEVCQFDSAERRAGVMRLRQRLRAVPLYMAYIILGLRSIAQYVDKGRSPSGGPWFVGRLLRACQEAQHPFVRHHRGHLSHRGVAETKLVGNVHNRR